MIEPRAPSQFGPKAPDWWPAEFAWPPEGKANGFDLDLDFFMDAVDRHAPGGRLNQASGVLP